MPMPIAVLKKYPAATAVVFLVLMILLPYWKLTTMQGFIITDDVFTSDIMNESFPYRHYIGEALKQGELPTWLPYIYGGIPLLARAEAGVCYPPNLILFGLLPPYTALNLVILLTLIIAALGMYFYARELDAGIAGALVAAVAFAYSGFMVAHIKHLSTVGTVCWFPLGLFFLERGFKRSDPKIFLWTGIVFALQNLSGHTQTAYYSGLVYGCYFIFRLVSLRRPAAISRTGKSKRETVPALPRNKYWMWFVGAMCIAAGISAVQLIPTYELVGMTQRSGGVQFDYAASYAYDPSNIKTFFYAYANGDISDASYKGKSIFWEDYGYVGLLTILFAVYAAVKGWRKWHVKFFTAAAIVAYLLVLGPSTPLYEAAFHVVPGMNFFRFPTRFIFVVDAALAVLAALGLTMLFDRKNRRNFSEWEFVLLAAVVLDLLYFQLRQNPVVDADQWLTPPKIVETLEADKSLFRIYSPGASDMHKSTFAAARGWDGDLQPYIDQREYIQPSSNVLYKIFSADGYAQLTPNYIVDIWGDQNRAGIIMQTASLANGAVTPRQSFSNLMNLFNVKYVLSPWPIASTEFELMEEHKGVHLYRNPTVQPRAFITGKIRLAANADAAKSILLSDTFDPAREVVLFEQPPDVHEGNVGGSSVAIRHYNTNEVELSVDSPSGGMLVLSDTFYPGWKAEVDGKESKVYRANVCQRSVVVPSGAHTVRFRFASTSIKLGFWISVLSCLGIVVLLVRWKK